MEDITLAVAPINWCNDDMPELGAETHLEQCLEEMQRAGFQGTELGHKFPRNPSLLIPLLQRYQLRLCSAWHSTFLADKTEWPREKKRLHQTLTFLSTMGAKKINIAEVTRSIHGEKLTPLHRQPQLHEEEWESFLEGLHWAADLCQEFNIQLCYHHHMGTVIQSEAEIDRLMNSTLSHKIFLCADTGHLQMAGVDPHQIFVKYGKRISHIHLKDVRKDILEEIKKSGWEISFLQAVLKGVFTVPGQGMVDYPKIIHTIVHEMKYQGWMVVEAEGDPHLNPPLELARKSYEYLQSLLTRLPLKLTPMQRTQSLGCDFWNDSCDHQELSHAVAEGAMGATSNPLIVATAIAQHPQRWNPVIDHLLCDFPLALEAGISWKLIEAVILPAASLLYPVYKKTEGEKGKLCVQVNPQYFHRADLMVEQGKQLAKLAPNLCIKIPLTSAGLKAIEELTALGISVNATVSFTYSQVKACKEAMERGLKLSQHLKLGKLGNKVTPYITLMVGRLDDHLKRVMEQEKITIDPGHLNWAGIAVFKKCYREIFESGQSKTPVTLLAAAFRHHLHWSQLVGEKVILSMPYSWWNQFNSCAITVEKRIGDPVPKGVVEELSLKFPDFHRAYTQDGLAPEEFSHYGPTVHTLRQFLSGQDQLVALVRERMLGPKQRRSD